MLPMEGVRRHDELQHADLLVPGHLCLVKGEKNPTRPQHEEDRDFLRSLFKKVISNKTPATCEEELAVDSYQVRCAIAHWLEEESLLPPGLATDA